MDINDNFIFDWDGTIVNTVSLIRAAHNHVRSLYQLPPWTDKDFHKNQHMSSRDLYPKLYGAQSDTAITQLYDYIEQHSMVSLNLMPGADMLIRFLRIHKKHCGVVSNKRHPNLIKEINHLSLQDIFPFAIGADHAEFDKPSSAPYESLKAHMVQLNDTDKDTWYIGDTETDLRFANAINAKSVFISKEAEAHDLKKEYSPELAFDDCRSFLEFLKSRVEFD